MKKILLSALVIGTFALYSFHKRFPDSEGRVVAPSNLNLLQQQAPSTNGAIPPKSGNSSSNASPSSTTGQYKDGVYTGDSVDAYYGYIQVKATISSGKITDVQFLQYPNDRSTSREINSQAMPYLKEEALAAQNSQVDIVSGATDSSLAFRQSLASALNQAR